MIIPQFLGSGKTTVLVTRLGYMLHCEGIRPERILTVTYTVAATKDMKSRFVSFFGEEYADKLTFRTINGLCAVVIGTYARQKGTEPFALLDDERQIKSVIRDLLARTGAAFPSDQQVSDARIHITYCKNMMLTETEIHAHKVDGMDFPSVYFEYQDYLLRSKRMDYDDQMVFTYRIFLQYPDILAHFQRRWPYICVDEAQDTSTTAPPAPSWRRRAHSSAATRTAARRKCAPKTSRAVPSGRSCWRTTAASTTIC